MCSKSWKKGQKKEERIKIRFLKGKEYTKESSVCMLRNIIIAGKGKSEKKREDRKGEREDV